MSANGEDAGGRDDARGWTWRDRERASRARGVALDPAAQPAGDPDVFPTIYQPDVLLVRVDEKDAVSVFARIGEQAEEFGWRVVDDGPSPRQRTADAKAPPVRASAASTRRARIEVRPDAANTTPLQRPDAWRLLRAVRRAAIPGVSLNHILTIDPIGVNPFKGYPFKGYPFKGYPFKGYPAGGGIDAYASPGFGGRQPVTFAGAAPVDGRVGAGMRRPVVAVLDTGLGAHPWLPDDVVVAVDDPTGDDAAYAGVVGTVHPDSDPETHPSLGDPLDGVLDPAAGHGTFIAGLIRQVCPHARILAVRVSDGQGVILEDVVLDALGRLLDAMRNGAQVDVLNLSFGFFHESADAAAVEGELYDLLLEIRRLGCIVVCSAGNEATDRPTSPASLHAWPSNDYGITESDEKGAAPLVAVGALNPSNRSVAMFSNVGPWVTTYAPGVSIVSTLPVSFRGAMQADLSLRGYDRWRETLDIDDFGAGFAVWSGTSFSAPLVAGLIAAQLAPTLAVPAVNPTDLTSIVKTVIDDLDTKDTSRNPQQP